MPEMKSYMGVTEGSDGIIGKLLYYSASNILIPKNTFIELGKAFNLPKVIRAARIFTEYTAGITGRIPRRLYAVSL